jgi:cation diffusion facilitator family transporter
MSTHAGAFLLAAMAYTYARRLANDPRFTFGTGKIGDLAGFTSAIILAIIALLIGIESTSRLFAPVPIHFAEAIPIAFLGLAVNAASAWLLSSDQNSHGHNHHHPGHGHDESRQVTTSRGPIILEIFEDGVPPRFRLRAVAGPSLEAATCSIAITRPNGSKQPFPLVAREGYLESADEISEPHAFTASVLIGPETHTVTFEEHEHAHAKVAADNNMRAAVIHVFADAAVSVLVIVGLTLALAFGWLWMDPFVGIIGALVIASWSLALLRDTGAVLLDMNPDRGMADNIRQTIEGEGDRLSDLHLWRLGPGHLGAIISVVTRSRRSADDYRAMLLRFRSLSHLTIEIKREGP